jgi:hypothetical protein
VKPFKQEYLRGIFGPVDIVFPKESDTFEDLQIQSFFRRELPMTRIMNNISRAVTTDTGQNLNNQEIKKTLEVLGGFLLDIARLKDRIVLPSSGEELESLAQQVIEADITRRPISIFTPFCPDWSRDQQGRYDFKSLGGETSYIAEKFFRESQPLLRIFQKHDIPFQGLLIFANWGLETEITAQDTYGRKLTEEDVQLCFESTFAKTDEKLLYLQQSDSVFMPYQVIRMTDFFKHQHFNPGIAYRDIHDFFQTNTKGKKLVAGLHTASFTINSERLGLTEEENKEQTKQNLSEYATLGRALGDKGIIIAAESATATRAYNLPRRKKLPVFYLKGKEGIAEGVNIL